MSITRNIRGTYYICMFMMNNNRWGKLFRVPVMGDRSSGRAWKSPLLWFRAQVAAVPSVMIQEFCIGPSTSSASSNWRRSNSTCCGALSLPWQRLSWFIETVMLRGCRHQLPSGCMVWRVLDVCWTTRQGPVYWMASLRSPDGLEVNNHTFSPGWMASFLFPYRRALCWRARASWTCTSQ